MEVPMRSLAILAAAVLLPTVLLAQPARQSDAILDALRMQQLLQVMQQEAVAASTDMAAQMVPEPGVAAFRTRVTAINDPDRLVEAMAEDFSEELSPEDIDAILTFLNSEQGSRIVGLELSAREALLDPDIEAMSTDMLDERRAAADPRLGMIERFVEVNDLVDANVIGAMNANAAFLRGMGDGGDMTAPDDAEIAARVWSQESEIRASTEDWVYSFLLLAYQPLSDADLSAYIAFSESPAGQALNRALFSAFDNVFVMTSRETGEALARTIWAQDI
jgi:hypothetical protein